MTTPATPQTHTLTDRDGNPRPDAPWIFRTYAGHTTAKASNELFRGNLSRGQTGLSIAFDLPTQCGYSSDHALARPEVGKVGVPINSLDDFHVLFEGIPLEQMNTSMTINGTAMWLLSLYVALAMERGEDPKKLRGTTQNDIIKEYLARGTYIFPPEAGLRLIAEMYEYCVEEIPEWNPSNICSYHLQEAGATPAQELAFALATAIGTLDLLVERKRLERAGLDKAVGRVSFFVNSGIRFIEEMCKMRAFTELWDEYTRDRFGVADARARRFRYGVQVNSLGLTEAQPENNAWRILIEALGVTLSRNARCRALQLPAWNEALSLPREWDQQWSLRLQQILAYESDLLEYPDIFDGSPVVAGKVAELKAQAVAEIERVLAMGGVREAVESGYMKSALVGSMSDRIARINRNEQIVVGQNRFTEGLPSPLLGGVDGGIFQADASAAGVVLASLEATRQQRDAARVAAALAALKAAAQSGENMMLPSIECALARVTTGEWADALRDVFGEYRPSTGVAGQHIDLPTDQVGVLRARAAAWEAANGRRPRLLVGKPGLDGHSNGAEVIAVAAREVGFDVVYAGIRLSPDAIARAAVDEDVDVLGLSILSGSHMELVAQILEALARDGGGDIPVVVGGIIPRGDFERLREMGVRDVFTPADFALIDILGRLFDTLATRA
jgi:(2R)-ethylmalonyl-CoA mutase